MLQVETGRFTVGVFQDVQWAERGLAALRRHAFPPESLSLMAKDTPEVGALVEKVFGTSGQKLNVKDVGSLVVHGLLVEALQGPDRDFEKLGIAGTMRRVGFQTHDGYIFDTLTSRGGVLVAIRSEPRAADALAVLHAYGGGNAAIGAWLGRV